MSARRIRGGAWLAALSLLAPVAARPAVFNVVQVVRDSASGLEGTSAITVSPDGQNAYVTSFSENSVAMFARDYTTGEFRYIGKLVDGHDGVDGLQGASAIAISPNGHRVYVTGQTDNALAIFDRSASYQGLLTFAGVVREGVDVSDGLAAPTGVAVAPGGRIFVSSSGDDGLSAFEEGFPLLTQVGVWRNGDSNPVSGPISTISGMTGASGVIATSGYRGYDVYVSSSTDSAVAVFTTDFLGTFFESQVAQDGADGFDGLAQAAGLALSPDGYELYVAGTGDSAVAVLDREPSTSLLSFHSLTQNGVDGVSGLGAVNSICAELLGESVYVGGGQSPAFRMFEPDVVALGVRLDRSLGFVQSTPFPGYTGLGSAHVAAAALPDSSRILVAETATARFESSSALSIFDRDGSTGALTVQQTIPDGDGVIGVRGAQSVVASPDGEHVYVLGSNGRWITVLARNPSGGLDYLGIAGVPGEDPHSEVPAYRKAVLSPDGHSFYETRYRDNEIDLYARDAGTGALSFAGGVTTSEVPDLVEPRDLVISPDGENAYAVGGSSRMAYWLMAFARDVGTGALEHLQTFTAPTDLQLYDAHSLAITPDGMYVYVATRGYGGIAVYLRQSDGTLAYLRSYDERAGVGPNHYLTFATDIEVSPDGQRVCVLTLHRYLACAQRTPDTGELYGVSIATTNGHLPYPGELAFSPGGTRIFAAAYDYWDQYTTPVPAMLVYAVDKASGGVSLLEEESAETGVDGVGGAVSVAVSPDGARIYLAAYQADNLLVFAPEPAGALLGAAALGALAALHARAWGFLSRFVRA